MDVKVSIIIATFNRPHLLNLGISSIYKQEIPYDFEIIVINDGINDDTEKICESYSNKLDIKYYFAGQRNENGLISRAVSMPQNIGIKKSTGDIIILTCPEIYHLNMNGINNILSPLIDDDEFLTIPNIMYFDNTNEYTSKLLSNSEADINICTSDAANVEMPFLMGMWKKHAMYIRGYDEDFIGYASEDNDFVDRLKLIGCKHHRVDAKIVHLYHGARCTAGFMWDNPDWVYNYTLYQKRIHPKNIYEKRSSIIRNNNVDWGKL